MYSCIERKRKKELKKKGITFTNEFKK